MDALLSIVNQLQESPEVIKHVTLRNLHLFVVHAARMKPDIVLAQLQGGNPHAPPQFLSTSIRDALADICSVPVDCVPSLWTALKTLVWDDNYVASLQENPQLVFMKHGIDKGLASITLYPPSWFCSTTGCSNRKPLNKAQQRQIVLFTLADGPLPAYSVHLYCRDCHTNYHHNFAVRAGRRQYYGGVPEVIQAGEHQFVERRLVHHWIMQMLLSWTSASNCAELYNSGLAQTPLQPHLPSSWPFGFRLQTAHVWDAFVVLSLLEDRAINNGGFLDVPHGGDQQDRFKEATRERNARIQAYGQPEVFHRCDKCTRFFDDRATGGGISKTSCVVIDGITIGHPCCSVHNCKVPLSNQRHRFCPQHAYRARICSIKGCDQPTTPGQRVCSDPVHVAIEGRYKAQGQARFRLRELLQRTRLAAAADAMPQPIDIAVLTEALADEDHVYEVDDRGRIIADAPVSDCPDKPATGNKRLKAQFSRKRTHNEQIIVAPCGVVIARTTLYGAEAVMSVVDFIKHVYRFGYCPEHIFFDNNCRLKLCVKDDPFFQNIGLSVDVFHFNCKHSVNDRFCQENCNPAAFPELLREDGSWYFNSSVAEQTNVWLAGYNAICREMLVDKFNFFLDEMIMRRNRLTIDKLKRTGSSPSYWTGVP